MNEPHLEPSQILALHLLLRERSVSRAAAQMSISQSSMSHRLKRLRADLGDPLLVRNGRTLVTTPRAEQIAAPLSAAMNSLSQALSPSGAFVPSAIRGRFELYIPDLLAPLLPDLCRKLEAETPQLELDVRMVPGDLSEVLSARSPSLALAPEGFASPDLKSRRIGQLHFGVVGRRDHPALQARLSVHRWLSYGHVVVEVGNSRKNPVEETLRRRKLERKVALRVPSFLTGLLTVAASDYLMNAPLSLAHAATSALDLRVLPSPLKLPKVALSMLWHERYQNDPGHDWLRQKVFELAIAVVR